MECRDFGSVRVVNARENFETLKKDSHNVLEWELTSYCHITLYGTNCVLQFSEVFVVIPSRSQAIRLPNDRVPYSSYSPHFYSYKSLHRVIPDKPKSINVVLLLDISPPPPKKAKVIHSSGLTPIQYHDIREPGVVRCSNPINSSSVKKNDRIGNIGNKIEEIVDLARKTNLHEDKDDAQELLDLHNQKLTSDELTEIYEQQQDFE
ncbi:hypothetical protein TNCV_316261 [Trichonephila clavipes]|nr:hypothetical protein TNCV_316261 [Trichonephila clavipes]